MFPELEQRSKLPISQLLPPKFKYFANQNRPNEGPKKMNFENFLIEKLLSQTVRLKK